MKKLSIGLFLLLFITAINAQTANAIKWNYTINKTDSSNAELCFTANVEKGWHLYSQKHINGLPLVFTFNASALFKTMGEVTEPACHKEYDTVMQFDVFYFKEQRIVFKQKINLNSKASFKITGNISGQVCYDDGICLPLNENFSFEIVL